MLSVSVELDESPIKLMNPEDMFDYPEGSVFQQYFHGKPQRTFYVCLGCGEDILSLWFNDESGKYHLSTESKKTASTLTYPVRVVLVNAKLIVELQQPRLGI